MSSLQIIDSHAHYENQRFEHDRHNMLAALPSAGVELVINVGCDIQSSCESITLAETYNHVYATVGVHPHEAKTLTDLCELKKLCAHPRVIALGEIGLDFHYDLSPRDTQRYWFAKQLELAKEMGMPVVIHSREADEEVYEIIVNSQVRSGVVHSFCGNAALACKYVQLGFHIGITGVVTFDKTGQLQEVVRTIPLAHILLETDAPYMTPKPYRGKRNESQFLTYVAQEVARIKNVPVEEVCAQTSSNVKKLFSI